jgi:hypothetical protein
MSISTARLTSRALRVEWLTQSPVRWATEYFSRLNLSTLLNGRESLPSPLPARP